MYNDIRLVSALVRNMVLGGGTAGDVTEPKLAKRLGLCSKVITLEAVGFGVVEVPSSIQTR